MTASHSSSRVVDEHPVAEEAGVVDQHVEPAEGLDRRARQARGPVPVGDVVAVGDGLAAARADRVDDLAGRRRGPPLTSRRRRRGR